MGSNNSKFIHLLVFILLLMEMRCWIGFEGRLVIYRYVFIALMAFFAIIHKVQYQYDKRYIVMVALILLSCWWISHSLLGAINGLVKTIAIAFILFIPDKDELFSHLVKWFGWMIGVSLGLYLISFVAPIPSFGVLSADYGGGIISLNVTFNNALFYIQPVYSFTQFASRFNGPFLEPGDVGCACAFFLTAAKFDFKRYKTLWFVLFALIFSFSLAGYALLLAGCLITLFGKNKISFRAVLIMTIAFFVLYNFGMSYNGGDNALNELIFKRLESDTDTGIVGNNRVSIDKIFYIQQQLSDSRLFCFGYDEMTFARITTDDLGAGFLNVFLSRGLFGVLATLAPFFYFAATSNQKRSSWLFFFFLLLYYAQRTEILWPVILYNYIYGITQYEYSDEE